MLFMDDPQADGNFGLWGILLSWWEIDVSHIKKFQTILDSAESKKYCLNHLIQILGIHSNRLSRLSEECSQSEFVISMLRNTF